MNTERILLEHGSGGLMSNELISRIFLPAFRNDLLERLEDGAVFPVGGARVCFTTDSFVVNPIFFPGGDIGSLAINGTVNDLAMCGGKPLYLSAGFILEEGFEMDFLERIVESMSRAAARAGVKVVTGDTKVVPRGAADRIFINTSGVGSIDYPNMISPESIRPGDVVILNGTIGDHGAAIMNQREGLSFGSDIYSDSAPLNGLVEDILAATPNIHCMRDATRGGLGAILAEIAKKTGYLIRVSEIDIPVRSDVRGICEILGIEPLYLANEGKMVVFCPEEDAKKVLTVMKKNPLGRDAAAIGRVLQRKTGRVEMTTVIGGERIIDLPTGELVPRIC
ncbi:MAG: hydrogenase expression/formation protein HypE [Syntrophales bacterium]